jgi:hypothetical protein
LEVKDATVDSGSVLVYLVPNNSAFGIPTLPSLSSGTALSGAQLLGSILDSSLNGTNVYTAVSLAANLNVAAGTYWIEMVDASSPANGNGASAPTNLQWGYNTSGFSELGVPASGNMSSYWNGTSTGLTGTVLSNTGGPAVFEMQINTPEPASLAVLASGLMGLGFIGRRRAKKTLD